MSPREQQRNARIEAWLAAGGAVVAANERTARAVKAAFDAARRAEGSAAWPTPAVFSWESWVRERWLDRNRSGLVLLNPLQEQALWARVIADSGAGENLLHPGRLAAAAQEAYRLLCGYAPKALKASARLGWQGDAGTFSEWMDAFAARCRRDGLISASQLALELCADFQQRSFAAPPEASQRPPLLLVGFDRLLESQSALLAAWGEWQLEEPGQTASSTQFQAAPEAAKEVEACVKWLRASLDANPEARLMVVTSELRSRRGELERALLELPSAGAPELEFEFSMGVPLGRVSLARSAILALRCLFEPLSEPEMDWLLGCGHCASSAGEEIALAESMRDLRRRGLERPEWALDDFAQLEEPAGLESPRSAWVTRFLEARERLLNLQVRQSPLEWVAVAEQALGAVGWPGFRPLSSVAYQARERWDRLLEDCGSLGFDGSQMKWAEFVAAVAEAANATIFAAESTDAPIQVTEPLEAAGQLADGIWFLGANEENWPGRGQPHPLLPIGLQREAGMPHASPQADWELAREATHRLLASADEVVFSYARHSAEAETRPSRLVLQQVAQPIDLEERANEMPGRDLTEIFEDLSRIPYPADEIGGEIGGGSGTLTRQSLCPFQAFATARLNAEDFEPADPGLNAKQRGLLLHAVLRQVWSGAGRGGISTLEELQRLPDLAKFVRQAVDRVMAESFDPDRRNSLPRRFAQRYLQLEADRLTQLVSEWLAYERERMPFRAAATETRREITVAGVTLSLRLDRIDTLENGARLVIDYKTGDVSPRAWEGERPDDVQLPLYAAFAVQEDLEGLVFAQIKPGRTKFSGRVRDAAATLRPDLTGRDSLMKNPLTDRQLSDWRELIERLGEDFLAGRADVDPKDPVKTCERCHLHAVCRIYENQPLAAVGADAEDDSREDEETGGGDA